MFIIRVCMFMLCCLAGLAYSIPELDCPYLSGNFESSPAAARLNRQTRLDLARLSRVDQQIRQDVAHGFPGAALGIIIDGQVIQQRVYGYKVEYAQNDGTLIHWPQALDCATMFDLASNTKMYATNYALMHLVYQGKLNLNRPINYYIPEYTGCDQHHECRGTRLVSDLLTHRAGYAADPQFFNPQVIQKLDRGLYSQNRWLTESIILTKLPFSSARGGKPNYSDVDFMLLGILVEKISGLRLDEYLNQEIYQPLGLHSVMFNPLEHGLSKNACAATEIAGNTRGGSVSFPNIRTKPLQCQVHDEKAYYSMAGISGHAGLFADLNDMLVLVHLVLGNGSYAGVRLWNKAVQDQFVQASAGDDSFGLGWRLTGKIHKYKPFGNYASSMAFGHTGWTGTITLIDPEYNLAIVYLTNKKHTPYINGKFSGDKFISGQYNKIIDLIYQSLRPINSLNQ